MNKRCHNKPLFYFLLLAFMALQWSATHIHLASEHEHGGEQHQHVATAHQHQSANYHADSIDVASNDFSHVDGNKVVDLEHDCTQPASKKLVQIAAIPSVSWQLFQTQNTSEVIQVPRKLDNYQSYHQYSAIRLRAPPVFS